MDKMVSNPPAEVVGLKNKAEEPAKDEPLSKKPRTEAAAPAPTPAPTATTTTAAAAATLLSVSLVLLSFSWIGCMLYSST